MSRSASHPHMHEAVRIYETLRASLTRSIGPDGFTALLNRALALARADVPALKAVKAKADGSLEGLQEILGEAENVGVDAAVAIIAHLLELLVTFIGEPLTRRLVREAWPDVSLEG